MTDIKIMAAGKEQADIVAPYMTGETSEALKTGIPLTVLAAVDKDGVMGVLAGVLDQEVFRIDSLFVDPDKRRLGAGRALIESLDRIFPEGDRAVRAEFNIETEDNGTLEGFLRAMDFEEEDIDYPVYYLSYVRDFYSAAGSKPENAEIRSFADTGEKLLKGLVSEKTDRDSSFCILKDGKLAAFIVVEQVDDELIKIAALYSSLNDPRETISMINCAGEALKKNYELFTRVAMLAVNPTSKKVVEYFFDDPEPVSRSFIKFL